MSWRDAAADTGRTGDGSQALRGNDLAVAKDFGPTTIAEQMADGGWLKNSRPEGGTPPMAGYTIGGRGSADMHEMSEPMGTMD